MPMAAEQAADPVGQARQISGLREHPHPGMRHQRSPSAVTTGATTDRLTFTLTEPSWTATTWI